MKKKIAFLTGIVCILSLTACGDISSSKNTVRKCDTISAGKHHTVSLKSDGTVVAATYHNCGQDDVSDWTDIVAVSAGTFHTVGLKPDGTVVSTAIVAEQNDWGQCDVSDWTNIRVPLESR